ncbi:50S ribosomal protein L23 [Candidatus Parcubacteria bacterium]|nr:MAG: 50S ribosomal protein L23 [Candidatus Parcubacteria bacterium]
MALFGFKKKDETATPEGAAANTSTKESKAKTKAAAPAKSVTSSDGKGVAHVLRNPRITEKGTTAGDVSAYLFDVAPSATKPEIARAIASVYKVTPRMIRIVTIPSKRKRNARTGRVGIKSGGKKAYVYLTKGETITLA